jgi:uncharacterized RDD family membrane protein YckC
MDSPNIPPPPAYTEPPATAGSAEHIGFGRRFVQYLIDAILLGVVSGVLGAILGASQNGRTGVGLVLFIAYFTFLEGSRSQTLGMSVMGIKVVDARTGEAIDYSRAFVRSLGRLVASLVCALGYLWVIWDKEKQGWHDKIGTTYVVRS